MKDSKISINGINISYLDYGKGDNIIIFIHGFPFDKSSWDLQLNELKDEFRVIAYDIRGFGQSTSDEQSFSMDLFTDDLIALMDELKITKAVICGLSMGGYIALNAISRFPDRFQKLVLSDTQCTADSPEGKEKRYKAIDLLNKGGLRQWTDTFEKNVFTEKFIHEKENEVKKIRSIMLTNPLSSYVSALKALAERRDTCSILDSVKIPTLIICGEADEITPVEKSQQMHEKIKTSVLRTIPDAGHLSNVEQPEVFNKYLREFIRQI